MKNAFLAAVNNIAAHGDTDVLPFPFDNLIFKDKPDDVVSLLLSTHQNFSNEFKKYPPYSECVMAAAGYTGFRAVTQIDPFWNAYFLGLVIKVAPQIESARLAKDKNCVFSYRYSYDNKSFSLYDKELNWVRFQHESIARAKSCSYVLICDISDFYHRIYHHRLENALLKTGAEKGLCKIIMEMLMAFSKNVSYGLPVGGPAARLLSELLLNRTDRLLATNNITFCRYADDYHIFADSKESAYRHLVYLSEKLLENEGMLLQKTKTRILSADEYIATSEFDINAENETSDEKQTRDFLRLRLYYDPYSETAEDDYYSLKNELNKFDVIGMLARELKKSRIQQNLVRKLVQSMSHLNHIQIEPAIITMLDSINTLYPVFPTIMLLLGKVLDKLKDQSRVMEALRSYFKDNSHVVQVPANMAFAVRVLANDKSDEADEIFNIIYANTNSSLIRRDVILAMARKNADYWISDKRKQYVSLTVWERRSMIVASFTLGDEGQHWRKSIAKSLSEYDLLIVKWCEDRAKANNAEVPL